jgi:hypothetical protein
MVALSIIITAPEGGINRKRQDPGSDRKGRIPEIPFLKVRVPGIQFPGPALYLVGGPEQVFIGHFSFPDDFHGGTIRHPMPGHLFGQG